MTLNSFLPTIIVGIITIICIIAFNKPRHASILFLPIQKVTSIITLCYFFYHTGKYMMYLEINAIVRDPFLSKEQAINKIDGMIGPLDAITDIYFIGLFMISMALMLAGLYADFSLKHASKIADNKVKGAADKETPETEEK